MTKEEYLDFCGSIAGGLCAVLPNSIPYYNNTALTLCQEESQEKSCPDLSEQPFP